MLFDLDPSSSTPLYRQLRAALEQALFRGHFNACRLPSTRSLATELGISRNTVDLAYQELIAEGYIFAKPRSGLYVDPEMQDLLAEHRGGSGPGDSIARPDWASLINPLPTTRFPHINKPRDWFQYPYVFLGGQADPDIFPATAWLRCLKQALEPPHSHHSLQDSQGYDDPLLVERLCTDVLPSRGIEATPDEVLVTLGSQEGLFLTAYALVRPSTQVAVEEPGYPDTRHILLRTGATLRALPVDDNGLIVPDNLSGIRLLCVTPSHQFPTNVTLSVPRRQRLLQIAAATNMVIVEDDYDSEFRYQGRPTPALKARDRNGRVVYLGSFSKFLAPGLRLGFLVADAGLVTELRERRRYMIRHPSGHLQRALALFLQSGGYASALRRARIIFKERWRLATNASKQSLPCRLDAPPGGMSLWIRLPADVDTAILVDRVKQHGVLAEPGDQYFLAENKPKNYLRLGFGSIPESRIADGVELIGREVKQMRSGTR